MKGIILSAGKGTRLYPLTVPVSKQLLPVYDKPMIYYALSVLMVAKIKEVLIIVNPYDLDVFTYLLGDGKHLGMDIQYKVQDSPKGLPDAFILGEEFIGNDDVCLILGDNLFYGNDLKNILSGAMKQSGATVFAYHVSDPHRFGIVQFDNKGKAISVEEKPANPKSNNAVTGLYFFDNKVIKYAKELTPSARGELEIIDIVRRYLNDGELSVTPLKRGITWSDMGTFQSLSQASTLISSIQNMQGYFIGCPEEIAYRNGWISVEQIFALAKAHNNEYGDYLRNIGMGRIE